MAIGGDSWGVVVRRTFVEVVPTDSKHMRAKSEGAASLPILPDVMPTSTTDAKVLGQAAVVAAPTSARESSRSRPPPPQNGGALSKQLAKRGSWCAKLCNAVGHQTPPGGEDDGQRWQDVQDSLANGISSRDTRWHVVNTNLAVGVGFRREPLSDGPRMQPEDGVRPGESFRVCEQRVGQDGVLHLRVAGGRGWLPSTKPNGDVLCERVKHRQSAVRLPVLLQAPVPEQQLLAKKEDVHAEAQDDEANRSPTFSWDDALEEELGSTKTDEEEHRTTVVITDIAGNCTRDGLLAQLDEAGLAGQYDFVYLPVSFETLATHGYGIVNFVTTQAAQMLMKSSPDSVSFSDQRQGLEGHVANFQDSSLMHEGVPDQFKPVLFKNGQRVPFPAPTRPTRMPRELKRAIWRMKNGELAVDSSPLQVSDVLTPSSQIEQCSPSSRIPTEKRGGRSVANSRRARSRRDRDSCA
jgi:hypothetical protein